jgi:hypothetical protein
VLASRLGGWPSAPSVPGSERQTTTWLRVAFARANGAAAAQGLTKCRCNGRLLLAAAAPRMPAHLHHDLLLDLQGPRVLHQLRQLLHVVLPEGRVQPARFESCAREISLVYVWWQGCPRAVRPAKTGHRLRPMPLPGRSQRLQLVRQGHEGAKPSARAEGQHVEGRLEPLLQLGAGCCRYRRPGQQGPGARPRRAGAGVRWKAREARPGHCGRRWAEREGMHTL